MSEDRTTDDESISGDDLGPMTVPNQSTTSSRFAAGPANRTLAAQQFDHAGKREVDLYVRTYTTLLQSSGAVGVSSLEPAHIMASSSLHAGATEHAPDMNAFMYSTQRLPASIVDVEDIILGQSPRHFARAGYLDMASWSVQSAPGRRRRWLWDSQTTLAAYIASASDLDDLIPTIVAYQIEWNKFHRIFRADDELGERVKRIADGHEPAPTGRPLAEIGERLLLNASDWGRLQRVWGHRLWTNLHKMASIRKRYTLRMLGGTHLGYARTTRQWWAPIAAKLHELDAADRPIYFVSSNTHSIVNVLSGTARRRRDDLVAHIRDTRHPELLPELDLLESGKTRSPWENWLYFAARHYFNGGAQSHERSRRNEEERTLGIHHIEANGSVDVGIQVIDLSQLDPDHFDSRLRGGTDGKDDGLLPDPDGLRADGFHPRAEGSDAIIININYPLGLAAYHIMTQIGMALDEVQGVYVLGKAATLNGRIGDVMLANVVYDEHSGNTYWFDNCFSYDHLAPYLVFGAALDNQRAVTVKGTYLQNQGYLDFYYRENYTVVEMEAGPYLSALYEDFFLRRHPQDEAINLRSHTPHMLDLGIIHYASDTPYTRAQTLGARGMSFFGMDSTYASTIAILRRIFDRERARLAAKRELVSTSA